jgi:hypothetical protein
MSRYSKIAHERKRARSMFLELRARGFELRAQESPEDLTGYVISLVGPTYVGSSTISLWMSLHHIPASRALETG